MFIEQKKSGIFLAKKVFQKKLLVKVDEGGISEQNIEKITQKECDLIFDSDEYNKFEKEVYNEATLKEIVYKSKTLSNNIEMLELNRLNRHAYEIGKLSQNGLQTIFPIKFIYHSNNIEGSKIPDEEVKKIIQNKKYTYKIKNEIQEVKNSIKTWHFLNEKFIFNEANIKKLYHILTKDLLQENGTKYPRGFKKIKNVVNNNMTTKPEDVSKEIISLMNHYKKNKKTEFPLKMAFDFHLKYEQIHPFENGNGRTGRFLMNKILIQNGYMPMIVFNENKQSYSNTIASCNSGNKKKYYKFMIEQYKKTIEEGYQ